MHVTSRPAPNLPGRQTCSSTPSEQTPDSRLGSSSRRRASSFTGSQTVCQSTPSRCASAFTVVSTSASASVAQCTARRVSGHRGSASSCASCEGTHRTEPLTAAPDTLAPGDPDRGAPDGVSCSTWTRRPCATAITPHCGQPATVWSVSTSSPSLTSSRSADRTRTPSTPNITGAVGQPSLQSIAPRPSRSDCLVAPVRPVRQ